MKKLIATFAIIASFMMPVSAQSFWGDSSRGQASSCQTKQNANITFSNNSDYTMTLKLMKFSYGSYSLYTTVTLAPHSRRMVAFGDTSSYRLKIKAVHNGHPSYHDGGRFNVTCNAREWTEGTMSFSMSTYGNGLGPSISASEFEKNS